MKSITRYFTTAVLISLAILTLPATPAYAIEPPSATPYIIKTNAWRNVLETGDFLIVIYENTPYITTPTINYSEAFVWRLIDTDSTTELGQAIGANYDHRGYGYNVISFYFSDNNTAEDYWGKSYYIKLTGTLYAFEVPPEYSFTMSSSDYSSETDTSLVKAEISARIIAIARELDIRWALEPEYYLLDQAETGTKLSVYGQAFFRTAIYGLQSMAPDAFPFSISGVSTTGREWEATYGMALESQYEGTYLEPAEAAGKEYLDVDYNLMGMLLIAVICAAIVGANWYLAGGNIWRGLVECVSPLVIGTRLAMVGMGELGLLAAVCWIYVAAKIWRLI